MTIERDPAIKFHEQGTLEAVTRWISNDDEGLAEWFKNVRRAYQTDRADVEEEHRAAVLLLRDGDDDQPARIGLLDVGGATLEDVTAWSTWQDPDASSRSGSNAEEETQGNGGKAYMYRLFTGAARIIGVRDGKRNCKGFEGAAGTVERGTPGFMPDAASGREVPVPSMEAELRQVLEPYGLRPDDLPEEVAGAIGERKAFTLVEGIEPVGSFRGRIDHEDLIKKTVRHEQSTLALQQVQFYAMHNGAPIEGGTPLALPEVPPYPDLEGPFVYELPEDLPQSDGEPVSTTEGGSKPKGRLVLMTSRDNMYRGYRNLRPRWKMSYRTTHQMIGSKPISEFVPTTPGATFIYGSIELPALEPGYVDHGRRRPKDGPLVEAIDLFAADKIKDLARQINERRREDLDERSLDEVQEENRKLDEFKNQFIADDGSGDGGPGEDGGGPKPPPPPPPPDYGTESDSIELTVPDPALRVGLGVDLHLTRILGVRVTDALGRTVPDAEVRWCAEDPHVVEFENGGLLHPRTKGQTQIWAEVKGEPIQSERVPIHVWAVDHVLLTPREAEIPLGKRKQITAEVTNDEGERATDVYLRWSHDADDPMVLRIRPSGWVTGNRLGRALVTAGVGDPANGVWARIPVEVSVVPNPEEPERGSGFPQLLLTGRDVDPATDEIREGDPDAPALWQEVTDFEHNVWWLNLQSPEAAFSFNQRDVDATVWRQFHVQKVMEMVTQVLMQNEFTKTEDEREVYWSEHKQALDRHQVHTVQEMWEALQPYVVDGGELE